MAESRKVLGRLARPTRKSYRNAVKQIVMDLQAEHGLNDKDLAERLGCSAGTIGNARDEATNLDGVTLANIEYEFGPAALDPFLALGGSRAVPIVTAEAPAFDATLPLSDVLHQLIAAQHPKSDGGQSTTLRELAEMLPDLRDARTALDALIDVAEGPRPRAVA